VQFGPLEKHMEEFSGHAIEICGAVAPLITLSSIEDGPLAILCMQNLVLVQALSPLLSGPI
jgi:hypothetical protein